MLTLNLRHYTFTLPVRYQAGHTLTQSEADALNGLLVENVRNNVAKMTWARDMTQRVLSSEEQAEVGRKIVEYALNYQFRSKPVPVRSAVDREAQRLARLLLEQQGIPADSPSGKLALEAVLQDPNLQTQARRNVAAKAAIAKELPV